MPTPIDDPAGRDASHEAGHSNDPIVSAKPALARVLLVDAAAADRHDVAAALRGLYDLVPCADADEARRALDAERQGFSLIMVDGAVPPTGGGGLLRTLWRHPAAQGVPVIATTTAATSDYAQAARGLAARGLGVSAVLVKPYSVRVLRATLTDLLNRQVEAQWDALEPVQRAALKNTVALFNTIAEAVSTHGEVPFASVRESCMPLVQAVSNARFRDILSGVREHDDYTYAHSLRVATVLTIFGHGVGLRDDDLLILTSGGLLHDIGKVAIPLGILNKPGALDDGEKSIMRSHVRRSMDMLLNAPDVPRAVTIIAGQHHERPDGTGYPLGLSGTAVNELARMAALADMFVALTDRRVYKAALAPEAALATMGDMGCGVDQSLLRYFREILLDHGMMLG